MDVILSCKLFPAATPFGKMIVLIRVLSSQVLIISNYEIQFKDTEEQVKSHKIREKNRENTVERTHSKSEVLKLTAILNVSPDKTRSS